MSIIGIVLLAIYSLGVLYFGYLIAQDTWHQPEKVKRSMIPGKNLPWALANGTVWGLTWPIWLALILIAEGNKKVKGKGRSLGDRLFGSESPQERV